MFIFCQSTTVRARLYTLKSDTSRHYRLLLSSFVCFHVEVKVNSLAFAIPNFLPYSSKFFSHVTAGVWLKAAVSLQWKSNAKKKRKQTRNIKKRKQTENSKTPVSEQPVVKSICSSLTMRRRAASAIIVHRKMHNLQVGRS